MGLTIPTVEKACVCLDLKTGTVVLGVINLVRKIKFRPSRTEIFSFQIGCVIGAIASIAILIGYAVLGGHVKDALKESEHLLDIAAEAVGIGLLK